VFCGRIFPSGSAQKRLEKMAVNLERDSGSLDEDLAAGVVDQLCDLILARHRENPNFSSI